MGEASGSGRGNLPAQLTRFFGREQEGAALASAIGEARLVTVVGPPGCGKTRLAVEIERQVAPSFPDGVWFVDLATVTAPTSVTEAIGTALKIRGEPGRAIVEAMVDALRDAAPLLVVLDNCEHVTAQVAEIVQRLLNSCSSVKVMATSRRSLGVLGERIWVLPPLDLPTAAELFVDRAGLAGREISLNQSDRTEVEEICIILGCLPLGVELVAASARVLSLPQIARRLSGNLPLLAGPGRSPRHETMAATIEWSYRLLPRKTQELLINVSVFAGSFDLDAVQTVAEPGCDVLDALSNLVQHSLVMTEPAGADPMRYRMLEPIRDWARARLAASDHTDQIHRRHAEHYLAVFSRFDPFGPRTMRGEIQHTLRLDRVVKDEANVLAALHWARTQRDELLIQLCLPLTDYWYFAGRANVGRTWLEEALAHKVMDQRLRARVLLGTGVVTTKTGDYDRAGELLEESLALFRQEQDDADVLVGQVSVLNALAMLDLSRGDQQRAMSHSRESIARAQTIGHVLGEAFARITLAWAHIVAGDVSGAATHFDEVVTLSTSLGPRASTALAMARFGLAYLAAFLNDDPAQLRTHLAGALAAIEEGGLVEKADLLATGFTLAASEGRYDSAARIVGGAHAINGRRGTAYPDGLTTPGHPITSRITEVVGKTRTKRLMDEGARMTWDELIAEVIARPADREQLLTRREHQVAELVAEGLNNSQIAAALYISRRTVETHVANIKRKLGLTARHQLQDSLDSARHAHP